MIISKANSSPSQSCYKPIYLQVSGKIYLGTPLVFFYINKIKFCSIIYSIFSGLNDCLIVYIEINVPCNIDNETIMQRFHNMKTRIRQL